ncbi:MAG: pyridoxal phosphate-dependent aminotransferase [Nitrospinaceae bacterium]
MKFSRRIQNLQPSMTLTIDATAKALKAEGVDIIGLSAGEPDFHTPEVIKQAAVSALARNETRYTPVGGTAALKQAIVEKFEQDNGLRYAPGQIVVSCGAKHSFYNLAQVLWEPGDQVLVQAPYWVSYPEMIRLTGAEPVIVETGAASGFKMSPEQLEAAITPQTRAVVINSPCNPTGSGYGREEMERLCAAAVKHGLLVISDEIYEKIVFNDFEHVSPASLSPEMQANTVVINGASKAYAMTGWRIGYLAAPAEIAGAVTKLQGQMTSNPTSIAQAATIAALRESGQEVANMVKEFARRRDFIMNRFGNIPGLTCFKPVGTFYSFPDVSCWYSKKWKGEPIGGSVRLCEFLLKEAKVAVVPGIAFGADAHIRLSFASALEQLEKAMDRIQSAAAALD